MSFERLKRKDDLSSQTFFYHLQIRSFLRTNLGTELILPVISDVDRLLYEVNTYKFISKMYRLLLNEESDVSVTTDEQLWADLCQNSLSATVNTWYRLINYNILHQLNFTPEK